MDHGSPVGDLASAGKGTSVLDREDYTPRRPGPRALKTDTRAAAAREKAAAWYQRMRVEAAAAGVPVTQFIRERQKAR